MTYTGQILLTLFLLPNLFCKMYFLLFAQALDDVMRLGYLKTVKFYFL